MGSWGWLTCDGSRQRGGGVLSEGEDDGAATVRVLTRDDLWLMLWLWLLVVVVVVVGVDRLG